MTTPKPFHFLHRSVLSLIAGGLTVLVAGAAPEVTPPVKEVPKVAPPPAPAPSKDAKPPTKEAKPAGPDAKPAEKAKVSSVEKPGENANDPASSIDPDDEAAAENLDARNAAVAKPVTPDPVQIFGWREHILIKGVVEKTQAKLDTGALTSSIHAEEKELFERDGKKWVRFIVTDPSMPKPARTRIEAPLVRVARVKEPGGESIPREVVKLSFTIGDRKLRGDFTLNNRSNMLAPVLIGRNMIKVLGWVDPGRTYLADQKIYR
ncbi:MAG: RimK/LysX family protein [Verrucomicrobiota bacterium]